MSKTNQKSHIQKLIFTEFFFLGNIPVLPYIIKWFDDIVGIAVYSASVDFSFP